MEKPTVITVREPQVLRSLIAAGQDFGACAVIGIDLRPLAVDWVAVPVDGALFLGCTFRDDAEELALRRRGAHVLDPFAGLPYDPYRGNLYTPAELMAGYSSDRESSLDERIYAHFCVNGEDQGRRPNIREALAQRIHDFSVDEALGDELRIDENGTPRLKVVGVMGGHAVRRGTTAYRRAADLGRRLTCRGFYVVTGGGPGIMEAANLGAYLATEADAALDWAIAALAAAPESGELASTKPEQRELERRNRHAYVETAWEVVRRFPTDRAGKSLAIPTWFYGNEPTNAFATQIAKYFSNSIREDGLLAIAVNGVVYGPGSAGTRQEIFTDANQNHYGIFQLCSPMVFLGTDEYGKMTPPPAPGSVPPPLFPIVQAYANENYRDLLLAADEPEEIVRFLEDPAHRPRPPRV